VIAALLCLAGTGSAQAQAACGPLKLLSSQQMARFGSTDVMVVPVTLNGMAKGMILDTGAGVTQLSRAVAEELKLNIHRSRDWRHREARDVSGNISTSAATVHNLSFGKVSFQDIELHLWPDPAFARATPLLAGMLSHDLLFDYDVDVDFGTGILKLFSKDHCFGAINYWHPPAMAAMRIAVRDGHLHIPVSLDGHALDAVIDTGSQYSIVSLPLARRTFGLSAGSPGVTPLGAVNNDPALNSYMHTFASLSFGGVTVLTPDMMLLPDRMARGGDRTQQTGNRALFNTVLPDITIGMDVLRHLHIYLAPDEHNFYVSLTASPAAPPAKP
jgi:predicted aspartyl protease